MAELPAAEEINVREILDKYLSGEIDLICVLGPTASGKTRYAVQLARRINALLNQSCTNKVFLAAEIISADSRRSSGSFHLPPGKLLYPYPVSHVLGVWRIWYCYGSGSGGYSFSGIGNPYPERNEENNQAGRRILCQLDRGTALTVS